MAASAAGAAAILSGGKASANNALSIGLIGVGGRCHHLLQSLLKIPDVRVTAVCDVWDAHLERALEKVGRDVFKTKVHEELLGRKDIDAVLVATPDHWHVPITIDACRAGKDVYVEKPLTHKLEEGEAMLKVQQETGRIVQVGTQQRSMPHYAEAYEVVKSGILGPVKKVHMTWNRNSNLGLDAPNIPASSVDWKRFLGNAPDQPFDPYRFRGWRMFWDFGGGIFTDLMVHKLDIVNWFLDLKHPASAASIGDHFQTAGVWEAPDTVQTLLRYPDKELQAYYEGTFYNARNGAMIEFMGRDATLYIDRGRYEVHPEPGRSIDPVERILGSGPRGADFYDVPDGEMLHLTNWIDCIRSRKTPNSPVQSAVHSDGASHLANRSLRTGKIAQWGEG